MENRSVYSLAVVEKVFRFFASAFLGGLVATRSVFPRCGCPPVTGQPAPWLCPQPPPGAAGLPLNSAPASLPALGFGPQNNAVGFTCFLRSIKEHMKTGVSGSASLGSVSGGGVISLNVMPVCSRHFHRNYTVQLLSAGSMRKAS